MKLNKLLIFSLIFSMKYQIFLFLLRFVINYLTTSTRDGQNGWFGKWLPINNKLVHQS